jgi:predicted permease
LITVQVAMALTPSISGGLLVRSFWKVQQVSPGFDAEYLLKASILIPPTKSGPAKLAFIDELKERLQSLDGISAAGTTSNVLVDKIVLDNLSATVVPELTLPDGTSPTIEVPVTEITSDYFKVMGVPFVSGGSFQSDASGPEAQAIVNQELARRFWPGVDPVGKRFKFDDRNFKSPWLTVLGVVSDSRRQGLDRAIVPEIYLPFWEGPNLSVEIVARTAGDPKLMLPIVRSVLKSVDKNLVVVDIRTMEQQLGSMVLQRKFMAFVLGGFAVSALVLASIGTYGVTAYAVLMRTHEIGVRLAVGASQSEILKLLIRDGLKPVVIGIAIGSIVTLYLMKSLSSFLFGVVASDPLTLFTATLTLSVAAFVACLFSALRSRNVDPLTILRSE